VQALQKLNHPNILQLKEVTMENHELFFIFEHMVRIKLFFAPVLMFNLQKKSINNNPYLRSAMFL
jgi:hypothetical protein